MVARVLGAAPVLADAIIDQLAAPSDKATDAGVHKPDCHVVFGYLPDIHPYNQFDVW